MLRTRTRTRTWTYFVFLLSNDADADARVQAPLRPRRPSSASAIGGRVAPSKSDTVAHSPKNPDFLAFRSLVSSGSFIIPHFTIHPISTTQDGRDMQSPRWH